MEHEYLTIQEAIPHIGKSEETIRRWVRHTRAQFQVELNETNVELEQKTVILRKRIGIAAGDQPANNVLPFGGGFEAADKTRTSNPDAGICSDGHVVDAQQLHHIIVVV